MVHNLDNEIWVPVNGYEGIYEVSNMGRIKTLARTYYGGVCPVIMKEKLRKFHTKKKGYLALLLSKDTIDVNTTVHRVVAKNFIPNPENKPQVNHKNGNPSDNRVENLEWCTNQENMTHSWKVLNRKSWPQPKGADSPLSKKICCDNFGLVFNSIKEACEILDVNNTRVTEVCKDIKVHTKGLTFRFI